MCLDLKLFHPSGVKISHKVSLIGEAGHPGLERNRGHALTTHKATRVVSPSDIEGNRKLAHV